MAGSTRIRGTKLALTLGTPGVDFWADLTKWELSNEEADSDVTTFADAAEGGAEQWKLKLSAIQSTQTASFWAFVWDHAGEEVAFTVAPHGNTSPSIEQPHFIGQVRIGRKPSIGGEAGTGAYTFDVEWEVIGEPVRDDGVVGE